MESIKLRVASLATACIFVISTLVFTTAVAGPDLVSSDTNGQALITDEANPAGYSMLDVSADGRYVLLGNFDTSSTFGFGQLPLPPESCRILRKDRVTGELLTVFENEPSNFGSCSRAKISADGNIVVISPRGPVVSCVDGGEVTALIARNIATGTDTEVKTFWTPPPGDISRICVGNGGITFPGLAIYSITGDARFALVANGSALSGTALTPNYELVDIAAGTFEPIEVSVEDGITPQIYSAAISEDGNKLALNVRLLSPYTGPLPNPGVPVGEQPTGPSDVINCGQTGRCDRIGTAPTNSNFSGNSWWAYGYNPTTNEPCGSWWECPVPQEPPTNSIYIIDRIADTQTLPEALSNLSHQTILQAKAWSADGNQLSWIEGPVFPVGKCFIPLPGGEPDCMLPEGCSAADCELKIHRYNFSEDVRSTKQTYYDPDTLSICRAIPTTENYLGDVSQLSCGPRLSRNGDKLLYGRAVAYPFGGDWQPSIFSGDISFICVTRESLIAGGEPEFVECPVSPGPIIPGPGPYPPIGFPGDCLEFPDNPECQLNNFFNGGNGELGQYDPNNPAFDNQYNKEVISFYPGTLPTTDNTGPIIGLGNLPSYSAPVLWYVLNLETDHTALVSITDKGQLFQSNGALFSDDGTTVVFHSQDPRLQNTDPEALAETEATLDEACFWSPAGSSSNLRVATNDNVDFTTEDGINIYRETPVFCPVPDPALPAHIFAGDIASGVDLAVMTFRGWPLRKGTMQTWIGNYSRDNATMVVLTIEVRGLGENGAVFVDEENNCASYAPVAATSSDDSILIRCEIDALGSREFQPVRWRMTAEKSTVATITTHIEGNEPELRAHSNTHTTHAWLWNRRSFSWFWRWR